MVERTDYDVQGRVISHVAFGGDTTATAYAWNGSLQTLGMGTFSGWQKTTTYANGRAMVEQSDIFDRQVYEKDLGDRVSTMRYDRGGRMAAREGAGATAYTWFNTGLLGSASFAEFLRDAQDAGAAWRALRRSETSGRPLGNAAWIKVLEERTGRTLALQRGLKPRDKSAFRKMTP